MNGTLVLIAVALSVVLVAGMAPAFAYYPVNDFNDEVAGAPTRIPIADSTYDYDYDNNVLNVTFSGFTPGNDYEYLMFTCVDDGTTLASDPDGSNYGAGNCDTHVGVPAADSGTRVSFTSDASTVSAGNEYFVTILFGPFGSDATHNAQFIITIGATSADGVTVVYAPIGATGVAGTPVNQHDGTDDVNTQFFDRPNTAGQLLISDPAGPATPRNAKFMDLRILEKPEDNSIDPILSIDRNGIRYGTDITTTPQLLTFTVASDVTGMRSNPAQVSIQVFPNNAPIIRSDITRNVDHNGTLRVLFSEHHSANVDVDPSALEPVASDPDQGDRLMVPEISAGPSHGTVKFLNDTAGFAVGFIYTHSSTSDDPDSFTFSVADEHGLRSANELTMTITVGGSELIQIQDFDFSILKGTAARIPLTSWIIHDPEVSDDYFGLDFLVPAEHATITRNNDRNGLIYDHNDSDATEDTFTFRVTNNAGIQTGYMTSVVTIHPGLMGNDFKSIVYNPGGNTTIPFNGTSTDGESILDDYGFITFDGIIVTSGSEPAAGAIALSGDNRGITYVHDGTVIVNNVVDEFTFKVTGEGDGQDYTSDEITATIEIRAPRAPTADNSTITVITNPSEHTDFLFEKILHDPNIDPNSDDPLPIARAVIDDTAPTIGDADLLYLGSGGEPVTEPPPEGTGVAIGIRYTPNEAAIENGTDVIIFTITDEDDLTSTIGFRVEFGSSGGGDDDQQWKRKPTFGESHLTGALIVENGFSFNGNRLDITDNWHTDFARTSSIIGEHNTVTIKTYANDPLRRVSLSLAIPEVGALHDAETDIHVMLQRNYSDASGYNVINVMHEQKEQLVNATHTTASIGPAKCTSTSEDERCYEVEISFVVTAPLKHDVVAITAVDSKRYSTTTYINEGVVFEGDALLPAHTHQMTQKRGNQHPAETIQLTQQDRRFELWEDQHGLLWTKNTHGTWMRLTHPDFERPDDPEMSIKTRLHSDFASMVQYERDRALLVFDSASISSEPDEPFTYEYRLTPSKLSDPEILERMRVQSELAELTYGGN